MILAFHDNHLEPKITKCEDPMYYAYDLYEWPVDSPADRFANVLYGWSLGLTRWSWPAAAAKTENSPWGQDRRMDKLPPFFDAILALAMPAQLRDYNYGVFTMISLVKQTMAHNLWVNEEICSDLTRDKSQAFSKTQYFYSLTHHTWARFLGGGGEVEMLD